MHTDDSETSGPTSFLRSRSGIVLLGFLAIAAFFLITEHTAHVLGALPYLLVLGCLVMHVFMHGGHGGHSGQADDPASEARRQSKGDGDS